MAQQNGLTKFIKLLLDAIEEYTVNNPNEKKAKDILKLFKDLDIEDKEDYIEVIEEKKLEKPLSKGVRN